MAKTKESASSSSKYAKTVEKTKIVSANGARVTETEFTLSEKIRIHTKLPNASSK